MCLCGSKRTSYTNGDLKGSINAGRYTADYLSCGNLPYPACNIIIKKQETIPATGHSWDNGKVTKEATCTEEGEKTYTCTTCQKTRTESIAKTGHTEVKDAAVAETCESEGKTEGSHCSVCGTVIKAQEPIPATGHSWDNGKITKEATCTAEGEKIYTCTTCQKTRTESIAKTGHTEVKDAAIAATCESEGKTEGSHCSVCNKRTYDHERHLYAECLKET